MTGIVFCGDIKLCPFAQKYIDILKERDIRYEIINWDRTGQAKKMHEGNVYTFRMQRKRYANPFVKLISFISFRNFAIKIIRRKKYDKLIILTTGTGILLYRTLLKKYRHKFIFDYRDSSHENLTWFKKMVGKLAKASHFTCISSKGFKQILPKDMEYIIAHNFKYDDLQNVKTSYEKNKKGPINISYIGVLRQVEYLKSLIDKFGNDKRFNMYIHGGGDRDAEIITYASKYDNVFCTGKYDERQKQGLIESADILCYNYPAMFKTKYALANKFYDGLIYKKPFYANIDSFSGKLIHENNLGICLHDAEDNITDKIYNYYMNFREERFCADAQLMLKNVVDEDKVYIKKIEKFVED